MASVLITEREVVLLPAFLPDRIGFRNAVSPHYAELFFLDTQCFAESNVELKYITETTI